MKKMIKYFLSFLLVVMVVLFFNGSFAVESKNPKTFKTLDESNRYEKLQKFTRVLNLVQQYYVEDVDTNKLVYGAIKGMLKELDPHTNYLNPEIFKEFETETSGKFCGIGIEPTIESGILTVISPIEDSPAWKAGIKAGDKIIKIDGESTKGMSLAEASQKISGKKGSKVSLQIFRKEREKKITISVVRDIIKIKSVKYSDLNDGLAYIKITSFIESTYDDLKKILKDHVDVDKEKKIKGLILDLRKNPGGLFDQAIKVSDLFLDKGIIVSTLGRNKKEKEIMYAKKTEALIDFPMIVLVDEYSASASEIVAGAFKDNKRALIMGKKTFGKGSVQSMIKFDDSSGLKVTVARYYTPNGNSIQARGIIPDVILNEFDLKNYRKYIVEDIAQREENIKGHLLNDKRKNIKKANQYDPTVFFWYKSLTKKDQKNKKQSKADKAKDLLFKNDFQLLQAYNYLKTWQLTKSMHLSNHLEQN